MKLFVPLLIGTTAALLSCSCDRDAGASNAKVEDTPPASPATPAPSTNTSSENQSPAPTAIVSTEREKYQGETEEQLRARLTDLEYEVTQNEATERPFTNKFDEHFEEGIYVCIISGEALFSSKDKYDSGCGWPAFTKPINASEVNEKTDYKIGYARTEVRSKTGNSHLGHVFEDGPADRGGLRYCINSASLRFVPKGKLVAEGYGEFVKLFDGGSK